MNVNCYAQRLLNPFRGVLNTIVYASAEAVTTDGVHWGIYVRDDELVKDLPNSHKIQTNDIRYGSWSEEEGLRRGPISPSEDFKRLEEMGAIVYEHLLREHQRIPFPLKDSYELWMLNEASLPLALIDSAVTIDDLDFEQAIEWRAGLDSGEHFNAAVFDDFLKDSNDSGSAIEYLTRYVDGCAGKRSGKRFGKHGHAQWFQRQEDGGGTGLSGINISSTLLGRRLRKEEFPGFLINTAGHDARHTQLLEDFIRWQAPWLLVLQDLPKQTRAILEQQARQQAIVVDKQFRLYPEIIDESAIKAARVEAMLRNSQPVKKSEEEIMSTFYIELHPSPTE